MPSTTIISGGSRGLGLAVVERLLERGDCVATFSRSGSATLESLAAIYPDRLHTERFDAADADAIREFVARAAARFGGVDPSWGLLLQAFNKSIFPQSPTAQG
jgi:3-oxoacyl-[acyl-carrier protein] reductase